MSYFGSLIKNMFLKVFPIYKGEWKRFIPMALMMFFILFNYTILRNVKDTLVTNGKGADADIIAFIKLWGTMPAAILFVVLYSKMSNLMSKTKLFYVIIGGFLAFFGSFAFFIYPNLDYLHPSIERIHNLQEYYPNVKVFIAMWGNWTYCLFYILAELWGSVILSLFFWQLANETTSSTEARRFYPLFGFVGNASLILAALMSKSLVGYAQTQVATIDPWQLTLNYLMPILMASGCIIIGLFYWVNKKADATLDQGVLEAKPKKKKPKLGVLESFKYIFTSYHILCIAILVLSYGITMNYIDVLWKGQVKILTNGDKNASLNYFASFSFITGIIAMISMLLGGAFLRVFGWLKSACVLPVVVALTAILFFGAIIYGNSLPANEPVMIFFGMPISAVLLAATIGTFSGAFTKASKYSLFDATKEMAYIPLDDELKTKGKAAVDVTGGRLGKSGGAATIFLLRTLMPAATLAEIAPFLAGFTAIILVGWFFAVGKLNVSLKQLQGERDAEEVSDKVTLEPVAAK